MKKLLSINGWNPQVYQRELIVGDRIEKIAEINRRFQDGLANLASVAVMSETGKWAYWMNYDIEDLLDATSILTHVAANIGIKSGAVDEKNVQEMASNLKEAIYKLSGVDTVEAMAEIKKKKKKKTEM